MRCCDGGSYLSTLYVEKGYCSCPGWLEVLLELALPKILDLPKQERPREKAIRYGIETLSNEEILAILLRTGTKDVSALDLAHDLYNQSHGLQNLLKQPFEALLDVRGIGPGKALILSACFELSKRYGMLSYYDTEIATSGYLYQRYIGKLSHSDQEQIILVILNTKKRIIHEEIIYRGSEDSVDCDPLLIVKNVILHKGKYFYIIHNHPSGNAQPSDADRVLTANIIATANTMRVILLDHIVIGSHGYYSFIEDIEVMQKRLII